MKVDKALVDKVASLAKLEFKDDERENIRQDLERILEFVDKLNEVNTDGVEPLVYITDEKNVLRPDEINHIISRDEALRNAPMRDSDYFKVPKVLKK